MCQDKEGSVSAIELGKRYERLMMSSAPLAIAAAFLLFTSIASKDQDNSSLAKCYELAAGAVASNRAVLQDEWDTFHEYSKKIPEFPNVYPLTLRMKWMNAMDFDVYQRCAAVTTEVRESGDIAPAELEQRWRAEARKRLNAPVVAHGISIESETVITIVGTKVKVRISTLTTALQFALGPLLVLWLGSLYQTRFRESIYNSRARSLVEVYPHLINVYPLLIPLSLKKRIKLLLWVHPQTISAILYTCLRVVFVGVVLSPTVALYLWSLWLIPFEFRTFSHYTLGLMVGISAFAVLVAEALPWHWTKTFPHISQT